LDDFTGGGAGPDGVTGHGHPALANRKEPPMTKTALFLSAALVPGLAIAEVQSGTTLGNSIENIIANLEADGFTVMETETDDGVFEAEVMLNGILYEIEVDLDDGDVIEIELEDDDDDYDDDYDDHDYDDEDEDDEDEDEDDDDDD